MKTLIEKIRQLKLKRQAVILAHNYQEPEVQDVADFTGDSLGLSRQAAQTPSKVIVFCGVYFMAETASILSPDKTVLIPDPQAGCPMADMIDAPALRALKAQHPGSPVVCYVNSSAEVKAESDVCCTSANAVRVAASLPADPPVIFVPDKYLADYTARQLHRTFVVWNGYCPTHVKILPDDIREQKRRHPNALVLAHPECPSAILDLADQVLSTDGMGKFARSSPATEFIMATENGMLYRLQKDNPGKEFYAASAQAVCPNMKRITLEKVLWALEELKFEVKVPEAVRVRALQAVDRMLKIA